MLKIEANKNFTAPKTNTVTSSSTDGLESADGSENEGGEFARILENLTSKKEPVKEKPDVTPAKEREKDSDADKFVKKNKPNEANKETLDNLSKTREDAAGAANIQAATNENLSVEFETLQPARAILHIADMERIVSSVRSQSFEGNSQVVITLKNSVFDGLQIKLTANENHRITAELIAANEKVKAQIDARSGELADLLRQRGVKLQSLQTSLGAQTSGENQNRQQTNDLGARTVPRLTKNADNEIEEASETSESATAYRI